MPRFLPQRERDSRFRVPLIEFCHHDDADPCPHQVCSGLVDGTLVIGDVGEHLRAWLKQRRRFPWVSIGEASSHAVMIDGEQALRSTVRELGQLGHRVLAYAGGPLRYDVHATALRGFPCGRGGAGAEPEHGRVRRSGVR